MGASRSFRFSDVRRRWRRPRTQTWITSNGEQLPRRGAGVEQSRCSCVPVAQDRLAVRSGDRGDKAPATLARYAFVRAIALGRLHSSYRARRSRAPAMRGMMSPSPSPCCSAARLTTWAPWLCVPALRRVCRFADARIVVRSPVAFRQHCPNKFSVGGNVAAVARRHHVYGGERSCRGDTHEHARAHRWLGRRHSLASTSEGCVWVSSLGEGAGDSAIVKTVIGLGKWLGLATRGFSRAIPAADSAGVPPTP